MFDLISIGSISFDIFYSGKSLTFENNRFQLAVGGKYFVDSVKEMVGGGGANVAIGVAKHNLRSAVLGKIGNNPFKKIIVDKLQESKVAIDLCQFETDYLNLSSILLNQKGERTIIHFESPHQHIIKKKEEWYKLFHTRAVYFGNLPEVSFTEKIAFLNFFKKNNIKTFVNLGVIDCRRDKKQLVELLSYPDVLILNGHEFADLVKTQYKDLHFRENVINWYAPQLKNKIVIVTDGAKGSFGYFKDRVFHARSIKLDRIIDTTGAGDGYTAGFIAQYLKNQEIEASMLAGTKHAAKMLGKVGAN